MIYMLWKECMPPKFYKFICKEENFIYLNRRNVLQPKVSVIITNFLKGNVEKGSNSQKKNPKKYEKAHTETCVYTQKPIKIDDFNEAEEEEVKKRFEKMKMKQREVAKNNKFLKKKKKQEKTEEIKKEMWIQ